MTGKMTAERALVATAQAAVHDPRLFADLQIAQQGEQVQSHEVHKFIQEGIDYCRKAGKHIVIVAPPEHGKSSQVVQRCVWDALKNPRLRTGFISADFDLAQRNLIHARKTILNPLTRIAFPDIQPDTKKSESGGEWSKKRIYWRGQDWPAFEAFSLTGRNEGVRLDCAWMDDCVTRDCSRYESSRIDAHSAIHSTWLSRMTGKGIAIITNNVWHREDPIHQMVESEAFSVLWIGYHGVDEMYWRMHHPPEGWPHGEEGVWDLWERWPRKRLISRQNEDSHTYKRLYEGRAMVAEECRFPPVDEWGRYNELPVPRSGERIYAFLDPSGGKKVDKEDFCALIVLMVMPNKEIFVIDCHVSKFMSPTDQIALCFDMNEKWIRMGYRDGIYMLGFEVLPKDEKWIIDPIERERARRRDAGRPWQLNVVPRHPRENKHSRIERAEPWFSNKWMKFPNDIVIKAKGLTKADVHWKNLVEQTEDFPFGTHDDGIDALSGAKDLADINGAPAMPSGQEPVGNYNDATLDSILMELDDHFAHAERIKNPHKKENSPEFTVSYAGFEDFDVEFG